MVGWFRVHLAGGAAILWLLILPIWLHCGFYCQRVQTSIVIPSPMTDTDEVYSELQQRLHNGDQIKTSKANRNAHRIC